MGCAPDEGGTASLRLPGGFLLLSSEEGSDECHPAARVAQPPASKPTKKNAPHALLWIATNGNWKASVLKVLGVYPPKEAAEAKRDQVMAKHDDLGQCYGHGDICVGDSCDDEIDLVLRPCEDAQIEGRAAGVASNLMGWRVRTQAVMCASLALCAS